MTDDNEVRYRYQRKCQGHRDGDTGIDAKGSAGHCVATCSARHAVGLRVVARGRQVLAGRAIHARGRASNIRVFACGKGDNESATSPALSTHLPLHGRSMRQEPVARRPQCLLHDMDGHVGADAGVSEMAAQRVSGMACIEKRTGVL